MAGRAQPRRTGVVRGNTVRRLDGSCRFSVDNETAWWQFWKPPPGSYISPIPQGHTPGETARRPTLRERIRQNRQHLPILSQKHEPVRYPAACNPGSERCENDAALRKQHLRRSDRPTHRLPLFQVAWLPALPLISQKVDTIFWCREQLARLNVEIEQDQRELERFPLMNSAFVQFNHQTAAHIACQCQIHHLPESMAPKLKRREDQGRQRYLTVAGDERAEGGELLFSYMILQALSTSSTTILQSTTAFEWFVVARLRDHTARRKWTRSVARLKEVRWGNFFPVYTNFACIALAYRVIAPLISAFAIISFSLLWLAHRYTMVYAARFEHDSGGVLYPRAINQTFVGIYTLELCVAGLFFMVEDQNATRSCTTHGGALLLTIAYQVLLNLVFSPLFRSLPITLEDEAVLRDEAFRRAQEAATRESTDRFEHRGPAVRGAISEKLKRNEAGSSTRLPRSFIQEEAIRDALYRDSADEMKDLDPQSRDSLTCQAFQHKALRSRPPVVWIPRDDLGISEDEIRQTENYSRAI
ncbi:Fc.00g043390.m01.CDS01 [Cosmosporella sp. VM-42]